ncbi:helix-turn-helix domain-containing protein [Paenibacillus daejeonensis]|uniref:helix-turn-helix domain-containing protein n=1 Tax=Paenibacillus daejeonensis TaxID=135193 RepID=UPI000378B407|nr:helix-turn-helix domain-containing protein [Paenibacillus daejeonensis]
MEEHKQLASTKLRLFIPSVRSIRLTFKAGQYVQWSTRRRYVLIMITHGRAEATVDSKTYLLRQRQAFLLPPGTPIQGRITDGAVMTCHVLLFTCLQVARQSGLWNAQPAKLPLAMDTDLAILTGDIIHSFESHRQATLGQELALMLQRWQATVNEVPSAPGGLQRAIDYMERHFDQQLQLEQLAAMAGYSVNHFSKLFKSATHLTPAAYLTGQRMERAKQLLLTPLSMKEVARQVGYRDEHYFSRVFKQSSGVAPTRYVKTRYRRVAALYYGMDDCLHTLGIEPVASLSYARRVVEPEGFPVVEPRSHTLPLDSIGIDYEALLRAKPELIVTNEQLSDEADRLREIAPLAMLQHSYDCTVTIRLLGRLLCREQESEQWLDQFSRQREQVRARIAERLGSPTACFVRVSSSGMRLYGPRSQTGVLLYGDLGLTPPEPLSEQLWARELTVDELAAMRPAHLFLMTDPTREALQLLRTIQDREDWLTMEPFRLQRLYPASNYLYALLGTRSRIAVIQHACMQLGVDVKEILQEN